MGTDAEKEHARWVHTLGNLTLTGYNSELSNKSFSEKLHILHESNISLNKYFRDVDVWNIDICVTGSQKCLMTPPGLALLSVNDKAWSSIERSTTGPYFDLKAYKKSLKDGQTPWTPVIPLFYALDEALSMILEEGLKTRFERHKKCAKALYEGIGAIGLEVFTKKEFRSNTVIAVKCPQGIDCEKIRHILRVKYNIVVAGGQGKLKGNIFRIGSMGNVSMGDVLLTISALEGTLDELGHNFKLGEGISAARNVF